ncbi:MAG: UPF0280 family protein [Clostridiales bacterium]|nr:UPF0280 family protein [Clostridiales bacterium]
MYEKRLYRSLFNNELVMFNICIGETDLMIGCDTDLSSDALRYVRRARSILNKHIDTYPNFKASLEPLELNESYPDLINLMIRAGKAAGTGPMAAVAGSVSEFVGNKLLKQSGQVFVENGGDIFFASLKDRTIAIYAGDSVLSNKVGIKIKEELFPLGICTSSGTVGDSYSKGKADAVTVLSPNTALADAVATALGNKIQSHGDIEKGLEFALSIEDIIGAVVIVGDKLGAAGDIELASIA